MQYDVQNKHNVLLVDASPLYMSDEKKSADDNASRNMVIIVMKREGDEKYSVDL